MLTLQHSFTVSRALSIQVFVAKPVNTVQLVLLSDPRGAGALRDERTCAETKLWCPALVERLWKTQSLDSFWGTGTRRSPGEDIHDIYRGSWLATSAGKQQGQLHRRGREKCANMLGCVIILLMRPNKHAKPIMSITAHHQGTTSSCVLVDVNSHVVM